MISVICRSRCRQIIFHIDKYSHLLSPAINLKYPYAQGSTNSRDEQNIIRDLESIPIERIRNFSIIAHVDHGKSTLADRLLEFTGTISAKDKNEQVLDKLQVERERGITVKAQTASLLYKHHGEDYLLNLIDTPGHVDFNYEVARSLLACDGVILLVDANQGVQAQTVANFFLAFEAGLQIIPVLNKIDLKGARPEEVALQIQSLFDFKLEEIIKVSAKLGIGIEDVLKAAVDRIPAPASHQDEPFKALVFDSSYDKYKGAVVSIAMKGGKVKKGDKVLAINSQKQYEVQELGIMYPNETSTNALYAGQVGYMYANIRNVKDAQVGETICHLNSDVQPLPGFKPAKAMVFAGVFPMDQSELPMMRSALDRLTLNDPSVEVNIDSSAALGQGWRLGFLGLLHMEVFSQRLEQEFDASVIMTTPNVPYKVKIFGAKNIKKYQGDTLTVLNPNNMPDKSIIEEYLEPYVKGTIITPDRFLGPVLSLLNDCRAIDSKQAYIDEERLMFTALLPLNEVVVDFFDVLKSLTSGYASFDYEDAGFRSSDLVKVEIALNGTIVDELAQMAHITKARQLGRRIVDKLKDTLPQQLYTIAIQAKVGGKIVCRENLKALRKDVLAKCYGGDISRKMKLLKRQAEGKKRMKRIGNVDVPKDAFVKVLRR